MSQYESGSVGCVVSMPAHPQSPIAAARSGRLLSPAQGRKEKKPSKFLSWFTPAAPPTPEQIAAQEQKMDAFLAQLRMEGKSDAEIAFHMTYLRDVRPVSELQQAEPAKKKAGIAGWFSGVQQTIKDEFSGTQLVPEGDGPLKNMTLRSFSASANVGPFYGALPEDMSYEELSRLEPVYVPSKTADKLPCHKHDGKPLPGEQTNCPVCLYHFNKGEKLKSLPCVHFFHNDCINSWLSVSHSCPVCKRNVDVE